MSYLTFENNQRVLIRALSYPSLDVTASRNLASTDVEKFLVCNSLSAISLTVPTSIANVGDEIEVLHWGTSTVSIVAASGVTITRFGGTVHQLAGRGSVCVLRLIAVNEWLLAGNFL